MSWSVGSLLWISLDHLCSTVPSSIHGALVLFCGSAWIVSATWFLFRVLESLFVLLDQLGSSVILSAPLISRRVSLFLWISLDLLYFTVPPHVLEGWFSSLDQLGSCLLHGAPSISWSGSLPLWISLDRLLCHGALVRFSGSAWIAFDIWCSFHVMER